ncbi:MAG: acyltransferase [Marinilabiliaceae bacterium]|nr:acyltransferase [Marinilabiliaceae bacterium]
MAIKKNSILEITRGIAAILVVFNHAINSFQYFKTNNNFLFNFIGQWGTEAVIIFFVLSGVVIAMSQERTHKSASDFLINRVVRIVPIFIISVVITLIAYWLIDNTLPDVGTILGNVFFFGTIQGFIVPTFGLNLALWSLSFEMAFYVLFCFVIKKRELIYLWVFVSVIAAIVNYFDLNINGILKHIISIFAYSSIWLLGYFVYQYRAKFQVSYIIAILSLSLLPIAAKINIGSHYYNLVNHFIFAFTSIPFFLYALNRHEGIVLSKKIVVDFRFIITLYFVLLLLIWTFSDSKYSNKLIYSALPIIVLVMLKIRLVLFSKVIRIGVKIQKYLIFSGSISYAIYCIHFPIMKLVGYYFNDKILLALSLLFLVTLVLSIMFELKLQPVINRKLKLLKKIK